MKRVFFLYFLWVLCLTAPILGRAANPWGILKDVPDETSFSVYAVDNLIDKRPVRYAVSQEVTPQEETIFKANILKWPQETLRFIQRSGRAQEFADIVPILQHKLTLVKVSETDSPDIVLSFSDELKEYTDGDFAEKDTEQPFNLIRINKNSRDKFADTSLHEIGHYFGLADQYASARTNSHAEYSSDVNYSDSSIMQASDSNVNNLTCDDADGLINLLDLRLAQRRNNQFSTRAQKGWESLCHNGYKNNVYQEARTINRNKRDTLRSSDYMEHKYLREYENGKLQQETRLAVLTPMGIFNVPDDAKVERDPQTNLIQAIYTTQRVDITLPDGTTSTTEVPYERHFKYYPPKQKDGKESVDIFLTEMLNGKKFNSAFLTIQSDGILRGLPNASLDTVDSYFVDAKDVDMGFYFADGISHPSYVEYYVRNTKQDITLEGNWRENTAKVAHNGQTRHITLPPRENDLYALWGLMEFNREAIGSYIRNFYTPLFGAKSQHTDQAQQAREQVKQALGPSR